MEQHGTYHFSFKKGLPIDAVEDTLMVAAMAVESLVGRSALKLDASFRLDKKNRRCTVDASTLAGQHLARILAGLLTQEFSESAFTVKRELPAACVAGGQR